MRSIELTNDALALVANDVDSRDPIRTADLLHAPVPSLCGIPAGRLTRGSLHPGRLYGPNVWIGDSQGHVSTDDVVLSDFDGNGSRDAALVVNCNQGGVPWPQSVQFYTGAGPQRVGGVSLETISHGDRDSVDAMIGLPHGVRVRWMSNRDTDYGCCPTTSWQADLTEATSGSGIGVTNVRRFDEVPTARKILSAALRGDTTTLEQHTDSAEAAAIVDKVAGLGLTASSAITSLGDPVADTRWPKDLLAAYGWEDSFMDTEEFGYRHCLLGVPDGDSPVLGLTPDGWNAWKIASFDTPA